MTANESEKTEKITINLGFVDLGQIDLLVQEGFYTNRTDFIRAAIRAQLGARTAAVDQTVARRTLVLGTQHYTCRQLEEIRDAGQMVQIRVLGLASIGGRLPGTCAGDHRLGGSAGRLSSQLGGEGRPGAPHRLTVRVGQDSPTPD